MRDFTFGKTGAKNWVCACMREGERVDVCVPVCGVWMQDVWTGVCLSAQSHNRLRM